MPHRREDLELIINDSELTELHEPLTVTTLPASSEHSTLLPYTYAAVSNFDILILD